MKTMEPPDARVEPLLQGGPLPSHREYENPESEFAENDRIHGDLPFMCAKPSHDTGIGHWFRQFTENVRINQVLHCVSASNGIG